MFEGTEAVLRQDLHKYEKALDAVENKRSGRLLAEQYLLPVPHWASKLSQWDKNLHVRVIDGVYDEQLGLQKIHHAPAGAYELGEVL
ncbi:hypothetical protein [Streptomyces sp. RFCAC02]|uniref:hypothetical protein n=1 Tax=Streptomyces sp. RFCAC02 TaxID=2499143 RepID=UPI00102010D7|nr:hypothetical protein [Streptomyces sp. RFCAC02]